MPPTKNSLQSQGWVLRHYARNRTGHQMDTFEKQLRKWQIHPRVSKTRGGEVLLSFAFDGSLYCHVKASLQLICLCFYKMSTFHLCCGLCICVCVHMGVGTCACVHMCVYRPEVNLRDLSLGTPLFFQIQSLPETRALST